MKKTLLLVLIPITIIIFSVCGLLISVNTTVKLVKQDNDKYERYLNKELYGTEVASIINMSIDQNERNEIPKDENGRYIENDENSIKVDLKMITIEKTYPMEEIYKHDVNEFIKNFNLILFKCTNIEYHKKTGRISKIIIEQIEY